MLREIHAIVEALREQLGLDGQYPTWRDTDRLLEECFPGLSVETDDTPISYLLVDDPEAIIVLPRHLSGRDRDAAVLEELGHFLFDGEAGASRPALQRLLLVQDARCERAARLFVAAWRLPLRLVQHLSPEEVLAESGCTCEELASRQSNVGEPWL